MGQSSRPMLRRTVCRLSTVALSCSAAASVLRAECNATPEPPPAFDFSLLSTPAAGAHYKDHFTDAYNTASKRHATGRKQSSPDDAQLRVRRGIAKYLMCKLGYTAEELALVSEDVTRTQGVKSPFPAAALQPGEAVVDLGSGFGIDVFLAASKVGAHGSVTGLDLSAEEVRCASVRAEQRGASNARFVVGDMEALPMPPATVDCVISNGGFCLCPNKRVAFGQIHKVLRAGGRMAIACTVMRGELPELQDGKRWPPCMEVFMKQADIEPLLADLGFECIAVDDTNARMDVYEMTAEDRKAAERNAEQRVSTYLNSEREAGIHWGNPEFAFTKDVDMNKLCARVVIYAKKPE